MGITVEPISVVRSIDQVTDLLSLHWEEVARHKDIMVLNPWVEKYAALEENNMIIAFGAFDDARFIGYAVTFIMPHMHYRDLIVASNDIIFLHKDYRASRAGLMLIRETERAAKESGAQMVLWHAKKDSTFDYLLDRKGYGVQDIIYSREL